MATFYDILGVSRGADATTIRKAFRSLAVKYHPDKNQGDQQAEEQFKKINAAYQVLSNPDSRAAYDLSLENPFQSQSQSDARRRYQERRRSKEYQQRYQYRSGGGAYAGQGKSTYTRKKQEPPIEPWKGYALVIGAILIFAVFLLGVMRSLEIYEARKKYDEAIHLWKVNNRPSLAQKQLNASISRDDEYQEAYAMYADIGIELGTPQEVTYHARMALELAAEPSAEDQFRLARCLLAGGDKEMGYYYLKQGIIMDSLNPWALYQLADLELYTHRRYEAAIAYFNRYLLIKPYQKDALLHKAVALQQIHRYDSAKMYLEAILDQAPQDPIARYYYGKNLIQEKDTLNACQMFDYALMKGIKQAEWYLFQYCSQPADSLMENELIEKTE